MAGRCSPSSGWLTYPLLWTLYLVGQTAGIDIQWQNNAQIVARRLQTMDYTFGKLDALGTCYTSATRQQRDDPSPTICRRQCSALRQALADAVWRRCRWRDYNLNMCMRLDWRLQWCPYFFVDDVWAQTGSKGLTIIQWSFTVARMHINAQLHQNWPAQFITG